MSLTDVIARVFVRPLWMAGPPKVEQWTCPTCGRTVSRTSPAVKTLWVTADAAERTALCARQHGFHHRDGSALPPEERQARVRLADLVVADEAERWVPVARYGDHPVSEGFVALLAPAGLAFVAVAGGPQEIGFEVHELTRLAASDLVGAPPAAPSGRLLGRLAAADLRFDDPTRPAALDVACLAPFAAPVGTTGSVR